MARRVNKAAQKANTSGCSVCFQNFPNQAERDRHVKSDHRTDASGSYLPVERYQPKRTPASSNKASRPKGMDTDWFEQNPIGQLRADRNCKSLRPSDVEKPSATISITTPVLMDQHPVLPDHVVPDKPPTLSPATTKRTKQLTCPICHAVFPSKKDRKSHRKISHPKIPNSHRAIASTLCMTCNRDFPTPNALALHMRNSSIHAVKHYCQLCSVHFFTPGASVVHGVLTHGLDLPCELCSYWFATEEQRAEHVEAAHAGPVARRTVSQKPVGAAVARGRGFWSLAAVFADEENLIDID